MAKDNVGHCGTPPSGKVSGTQALSKCECGRVMTGVWPRTGQPRLACFICGTEKPMSKEEEALRAQDQRKAATLFAPRRK